MDEMDKNPPTSIPRSEASARDEARTSGEDGPSRLTAVPSDPEGSPIAPAGGLMAVLNDSVVFRLGGSMRSSAQDLLTFFNALAESPVLETEPLAGQAASGLRSLYRLTRSALRLELFVRLQTGKQPLLKTNCEVRGLTEQFCREAEDLLRMAGLRLEVQLPRQPFPACVDWALTSAMLWELISNAAANSLDGVIRLRLTRENLTTLRCSVSNRPKDPVLPEALFQRHAQAPDFHREGMGLGLSLVRMAAERHGGSLLLAGSPEDVTAILTLDVSASEDAGLGSLIQIPAAELQGGLLYLAEVLPPEAYRLEDVL